MTHFQSIYEDFYFCINSYINISIYLNIYKPAPYFCLLQPPAIRKRKRNKRGRRDRKRRERKHSGNRKILEGREGIMKYLEGGERKRGGKGRREGKRKERGEGKREREERRRS